MAAQSISEGGLDILIGTPNYFANVLCELRVCHDLCVYSSVPILGSVVKRKIEECSVDFRHVSIQTAVLAERIGANWCSTCIVFFENRSKIIGDPSKIMTLISTQAKELSAGFKQIAEWIRELAGRFHDCQELAGQDKDVYTKKVQEAKKEAEAQQDVANEKRAAARKELESKKKSSGIWGICACIPIVNIVALPGYLITRGGVKDAKTDEAIAEEKLKSAREELEMAKDGQKKAEVAAGHVKDLILALKQVEEICEAQAAFWNFQSDKFGSFSAKITSAKELIDIGIDDSIDDLVDWLKARKGELETYHMVMQKVNNSYNFLSSVEPRKFPQLTLPTLDIVLQ